MNKSTITEYFAVVMKWRRVIIRNIIIVTIISVVVSLIIPVKYTATATILPPNPEQEAMFGFMPGFAPGGRDQQIGRHPVYPGFHQRGRVGQSVVADRPVEIHRIGRQRDGVVRTGIDGRSDVIDCHGQGITGRTTQARR